MKITDNTLFFPEGCSAQSWITNFLSCQINSKPFDSLKKILLYEDLIEFGSELSLAEDVIKSISINRTKRNDKTIVLNTKFYDKFEKEILNKKLSGSTKIEDLTEYFKMLSELTPAQKAFLVPKIILKYRYKKNDKFVEENIPFTFFTNVDDILNMKYSRGDGNGITSLKVVRQFKDVSFTVPNVEVNLDFIFQSAAIFNQPAKKGQKASFTKLITPISQSQFEFLVLEYGWDISRTIEPGIFPQKFVDYIKQYETKKMILQYTGTHQLNFDENGKIGLSVKYYAYQDSSMYGDTSLSVPESTEVISNFVVEESVKEIYKKYEEVRKKKESIEKEITDSTEIKKASDISTWVEKDKRIKELLAKKEEAVKEYNVLRKSLVPFTKNLFVSNIMNSDNLFHIAFETKEVGKTIILNSSISLLGKKESKEIVNIETTIDPSKFDKKNIVSTTDENVEKSIEKLFKSLSASTPLKGEKKFGNMVFFPLKALFQAAYSCLSEDDYKKFGYTMLSTIKLRSLGKEVSLSIGELFVELSVFQKWYFESFTKYDILDYSYGDFIKKVCETLIPNIVNTTTTIYPASNLGRTTVSSYFCSLSSADKEVIKNIRYNNNLFDLNNFSNKIYDLRIPTSTKLDKLIPLYLITTIPSNLTSKAHSFMNAAFSKFTGFDEKNDSSYGIPHLKIGASTGILNNISFSGEDLSALRTALWAQAQKDYTIEQSRYKYTINAKFIGISIFYNGAVVCIPSNPLGISIDGRDIKYDLGICGYYMVQSVTDTIQAMKYSTEISAIHFYNPEIYKVYPREPINDAPSSPITDFVAHNIGSYTREDIKLNTNLSHLGLSIFSIDEENYEQVVDKSDTVAQTEKPDDLLTTTLSQEYKIS